MENAILFIDDEENILNSLQRLFRKENYRVFTAGSGAEGLRLVKENRVSVVISDQKMPGMEGIEVLARIRGISPETVRMILTGHAEVGVAMGAINKGEVARFIMKPWNDEELKLTVRDAVERYNLVAENKRLFDLTKKQNGLLLEMNQNLEAKVREKTRVIRENFFSFVGIFADLMELYDEHVGGCSKRVARMSMGVMEMLRIEGADKELIHTAALLHNIGMIGVPREIIEKDEEMLTPSEKALVMHNPTLSQDLLSKIDTLRQVGIIIRSQAERYDGKGYPDRLKGEEIHIGARIIAACRLYDRLRHSNAKMPLADIIARVRSKEGHALDPAVVEALIEFLKQWHDDPIPTAQEKLYEVIPVHEMRPGMALAKNIVTGRGKLLVSKGTVLSAPLIDKVIRFNDIDPISEGIYVRISA